MSLRYSEERLKQMAIEFLELKKGRKGALQCASLLSILMSHFKLPREDVMKKIEEYAEMEIK